MTNKYKDWRDLFEEVWKQNLLENTVAQMIFTGEITEFGSRDEKFEAAKQNLSNTIDESKKRLISLIEQIIEGERRRFLDEIWDDLILSLPSDAENLSTLTDWQALELIRTFTQKLKDKQTNSLQEGDSPTK